MADELARALDRWRMVTESARPGNAEFDAVIDRIVVLAEDAVPPALSDEAGLWRAAARFEELLDLASRGLGVVPETDDGITYRVMLAVVAYRGVEALDRLYDVIAGLRRGPPDLDPATDAAKRVLVVVRDLAERYHEAQGTSRLLH